MQRIRADQIKAFEEDGARRYETELVAHLKDFSPGHAAVLGDEGLIKCIKFGWARANARGFKNAGPIRMFIEFIFLFGSEFDTDPQYPWVDQALAVDTPDEMLKADRLHQAAMKYLEETAGPDNEYARASLRWARQEPYEGLPLSEARWEPESLARLQRIYPQKCDYVGHGPLLALIRKGRTYAQQQGVTSGAAAAFIVAMMFSTGHRFYADPHLPWIEATLARSPEDPNKRFDQLYSKTMVYLDKIIAGLPQG